MKNDFYDVFYNSRLKWTALCLGEMKDKFKTEKDALQWCLKKMSEEIDKLIGKTNQ